MGIRFGGKNHGVDADASTKWKQVPVCGAKSNATGTLNTGAITCVRCLTKLGMPVPDKVRRPRIVYAGSWIGWTSLGNRRYTATMSGDGTVPETAWRLEYTAADPRGGWMHSGWYLSGPGVEDGKLMHAPDGDGRRDAAILAANDYITAAFRRAQDRAKRLADKGIL